MRQNSSYLLTLIAMAVMISACTPSASLGIAGSELAREINPQISAGDLRLLVEGNNTFAWDLYHSARAEGGNLILSPYSISLALAMTYAGARGETESQMEDVLHYPLGQSPTHNAFNALDLDLSKRGQAGDENSEPLNLNIANAVWAEQSYPFLQEFLDTLAVHYGAGIFLADFINQFEAVRRTINEWVADSTEGRIQDLLPKASLNAYSRMVLVNAIYFKADWLDPFDADSTRPETFQHLDGSESSVEMMNNGVLIPYHTGKGFQAIELPYAGDTSSMTIFVPDAGNFETFESSFDYSLYSQTLSDMQPRSVALGLPEFQFDKAINLSDVLKDMGMPDAFDPGAADFSGMTGAKDLFISNVFHKAYVAVDEQGTEAAAATAVIMEITSAQLYEIELQIDRPFIFAIRDKPSGQILFLGRVTDP